MTLDEGMPPGRLTDEEAGPAPAPSTSDSVGTGAPTANCAPSGRNSAEHMLGDLRQEIARADAKASVLAGTQGMAAAAAVGLLAGRNWHPSALGAGAGALWWAGVLCFVLSLAALLLAVVPRYRSSEWRPGRPLTHFGDIHRAARQGPTVLHSALIVTEIDPMPGLLAALSANSRIVLVKHRWIQLGLAALAGAVLLLTSALLLG